MTTKEKYELIDKTKVSAKVLEILEKMEKASSNFTNAEVNSRVDTALDKIIEGLKVSKPEALLSVSDAKKEVKKEKKEAEEKNKGKDLSKKKDTDDKTGLPKKDTVEERKDIIKKESESEKEARERAKKELEKENEKAKDVIESQIEKLNRIILEDPALRGFNTGTSATGGGKSTPLIDAERKAIARGRRVSQKGRKNQYGASAGGRVYWENRENRSDRKSPDYPTGKPYLAKGGMTENKTDVIKLYYHETSGGAEYLCSSKVKGSKDEGSFDSEYVVRIDGATDFGGELRIRKGGDIKRIILYYHKTNGGAEYLCSSKVKGSKGEGSFDSEFVVRIDGATDFGGELRISNMSGNKLAKGGNVYASDDLYEVKMVQDGVELDSKLIRARNKGEARMIFEDMYQEKYQDEFGAFDLEIEIAKDRMADGGGIPYKPYGKNKGRFTLKYEDDGEQQSEIWSSLEEATNSARRYVNPKLGYTNVQIYDESGKEYFFADGGMMTDGGSMLKSGYYAYPSGDEGNELGVFKDKESMISFAVANKDKYGKLIFEGIDNDDILEVNKRDSQDVVTWVFSRIGMDRKEANKKIKMWFISNYPADEEEAKQIDESVTFDDIWFDLKNQRGIYDRLGNSYVVREVFEKIASIYGVEYDFVEKMYKRESYAKGGYMADGGKVDKRILEKVYESYDIYKDGTNREHYDDFDNIEKVKEHIEKRTGMEVLKIKEIEIGRNYPDNMSHPYYHDDYEFELVKGQPLRVERMYGRPNYSGNVAYTNTIEVKNLWQMADGGRVNTIELEREIKETENKYPKAKVSYSFAKDSTGKGYVIRAKEGSKIVYSSYKAKYGGMMADGGQIDEDTLQELSLLVMDSIKPDNKLSLDEFLYAHRNGEKRFMTDEQEKLVVFVVKMYDNDENITEDELHELARLVMNSINPNVNLSLDEFMVEIPKTTEQDELCGFVLGMFPEYREYAKGGMMADGGYIESGEKLYEIANNMSDKEFQEAYRNLSEKEKDLYDTLLRLGDEDKIALVTVLNESKKPKYDKSTWDLHRYAKGGLVEEIKMFDKYNYPTPKTKGDKVRAIFEHFKKKGYSTEQINTALSEINYAKGGEMANGVDYVELINLIKSADNPRNLPIYYNSDSNVVNIGGVGYDKAELVKMFNARAGQSLEIKNLFYQANQYPQETKNRIESMNVGIEVEIGKGYGNETFVKYIKMSKGGMMADGGEMNKSGKVKTYSDAELMEKFNIDRKQYLTYADWRAELISKASKEGYQEKTNKRGIWTKKLAEGGETESEPLGINESVYFEVYDGNRNNGIIKFHKSGSRIFETLLIGNVKAGNRRYMSYFTKNDLKSSLYRDFDVVNEVDEDYVQDRLISYEKSKPADILVVKYPYPELAKTADTLTIIKGGEQVFDYDPITKDFSLVSIGLSYPDQIELDDFLEDSKGVSESQYTPELIKVIEVIKENEDINEIVDGLKSKGLIKNYMMAEGGEVDFSERMAKMRSAYENLQMSVKGKIASAIGIDEAVAIMDTDYSIHPFNLIFGAVRGGLLELDEINKDLVNEAVDEAERVTDDYRDSGQGIGGSDMTYFTQNVLNSAGYKTGFINNTLKRVDADGNELVIDKYEMKF